MLERLLERVVGRVWALLELVGKEVGRKRKGEELVEGEEER